jgi:hypothetical protein
VDFIKNIVGCSIQQGQPFAVLSVGGFLGMGTKYVVVPYTSLQVRDKKMVLPGATKDSLKALPEFKYAE